MRRAKDKNVILMIGIKVPGAIYTIICPTEVKKKKKLSGKDEYKMRIPTSTLICKCSISCSFCG